MSIQIPNLHTSNKTRVTVEAKVFTASRKDVTHAGMFVVQGNLFFAAAQPYPSGALTIKVDLTDSAKGTFKVDTVEQLDTFGRANPTVVATGRCSAREVKGAVGCRYWLLMVDNRKENDVKGTPDIISFLIYDRDGKRLAYGTGPLIIPGDVLVTSNGE